jgi:hypothetical protein
MQSGWSRRPKHSSSLDIADSDSHDPCRGQKFEFPDGASLIIDLTVPAVRYCVSKSVDDASTRKRTSEFLAEAGKDPLRALFFVPDSSCPFAALHQLSRAL